MGLGCLERNVPFISCSMQCPMNYVYQVHERKASPFLPTVFSEEFQQWVRTVSFFMPLPPMHWWLYFVSCLILSFAKGPFALSLNVLSHTPGPDHCKYWEWLCLSSACTPKPGGQGWCRVWRQEVVETSPIPPPRALGACWDAANAATWILHALFLCHLLSNPVAGACKGLDNFMINNNIGSYSCQEKVNCASCLGAPADHHRGQEGIFCLCSALHDPRGCRMQGLTMC